MDTDHMGTKRQSCSTSELLGSWQFALGRNTHANSSACSILPEFKSQDRQKRDRVFKASSTITFLQKKWHLTSKHFSRCRSSSVGSKIRPFVVATSQDVLALTNSPRCEKSMLHAEGTGSWPLNCVWWWFLHTKDYAFWLRYFYLLQMTAYNEQRCHT